MNQLISKWKVAGWNTGSFFYFSFIFPRLFPLLFRGRFVPTDSLHCSIHSQSDLWNVYEERLKSKEIVLFSNVQKRARAGTKCYDVYVTSSSTGLEDFQGRLGNGVCPPLTFLDAFGGSNVDRFSSNYPRV